MLNKIKTFDNLNKNTLNFYKDFGFIHYRPLSNSFINLIDQTYEYYKKSINKKKLVTSFRNKDNIAKQVVDIFNDKFSKAKSIYFHKEIKQLISFLNLGNKICYFTHSKLSFKKPYHETNWYPHQDNAYKKTTDQRNGFAIMICLENMHKKNGCIQLFPGSHKLKTLLHNKILENKNSGEIQLEVSKLPKIKPISIVAKKGDVVVFHNDMIHQSKSSMSNSYRFALISEIELNNSLKLDDYGRIPFSLNPKYNLFNTLKIYFLYLINIKNKWLFFKKLFPKASGKLRKIF